MPGDVVQSPLMRPLNPAIADGVIWRELKILPDSITLDFGVMLIEFFLAELAGV